MDRGHGTQWLVQPEDVVAHLFFAAAEIGEAEVEFGGRISVGTISFPSPDTGTFSYFANDQMETDMVPEQGTVIRLKYGHDTSQYAFLTQVVEVTSPKRWRLAFPRTIERNERRLIQRHRVHVFGGFRIRLDTGEPGWLSVPLFDLSTGGLSFIFNPDTHPVATGKTLSGSLIMPSGSRIPMLIEARHIRQVEEPDGHRLAGCRFLGLGAADHASLARTLAEWRKRHAH